MYNKGFVPLEDVNDYVNTMLEEFYEDDDDDDDEDCVEMEVSYRPYIDEDGDVRAVYKVLTCVECGDEYVVEFYTDGSDEMEQIAEDLDFRE